MAAKTKAKPGGTPPLAVRGPRPNKAAAPPGQNAGVSAARPHPLAAAWDAAWRRIEPGLFGFDAERRAQIELAACRAWYEAQGRKLAQQLTRPGRRGPDAAADATLRRELLAGQGLRKAARAMFPQQWPEAGREKLRNRLRRWNQK